VGTLSNVVPVYSLGVARDLYKIYVIRSINQVDLFICRTFGEKSRRFTTLYQSNDSYPIPYILSLRVYVITYGIYITKKQK